MPTRGTPQQIAIISAAEVKRRYEWGEPVNGFKVFACHEAQLDILASKAKFTFAFAGSGGGKTCLIPLWLFKQVAKHPRGRFLVVSPTLPTFESSELKRHIIDTFEGTSLQGEWLDGKKTYKLPTGGEIIVKTCGDGGDYQRLTGGQYHAIVADEVYLLSKDVWDEIRRRGNINDAPILAVTTPNANNWIYDIKQEAEKGNPDFYIRQWATRENPASDARNLDRERSLMSEAVYKRMYEGEFASLEGLVYECFSNPATAPIIERNPAKGLPSPVVRFFGGNDWGYRPDPACVLLFAECENGIIYCVEEIYGTEITPDDLSQRVKAMLNRWTIKIDSSYASMGGTFIGFYSDTSRPENVKVFRNAGIAIYNKKVDDIGAGIARTDAWFRSGRLQIYATCTNLIRELRGYEWEKDRKGDLKEKPKGKNDHAADCIRYAISSHKYNERITPLLADVESVQDERDKLVRIGRLPEDADEQRKIELKAEEERRQLRLFALAFGDLDD